MIIMILENTAVRSPYIEQLMQEVETENKKEEKEEATKKEETKKENKDTDQVMSKFINRLSIEYY